MINIPVYLLASLKRFIERGKILFNYLVVYTDELARFCYNEISEYVQRV